MIIELGYLIYVIFRSFRKVDSPVEHNLIDDVKYRVQKESGEEDEIQYRQRN
jgi:hypothetical protein